MLNVLILDVLNQLAPVNDGRARFRSGQSGKEIALRQFDLFQVLRFHRNVTRDSAFRLQVAFAPVRRGCVARPGQTLRPYESGASL